MAFTMLYVWEDTDPTEVELKFGDHYSKAKTESDAFADTTQYIRSSLGRQKNKFDEGRVIIHKIWDATEYAKLKGRFGAHQKVDDVIRPVIGYHKQADIHCGISADELIFRVNKELIKHHQPLPIAVLSQNQYDAAENVISAISNGKTTIVAELCARFGKTIWAGVIAKEQKTPLTIIASYVLTSFSSFKKDLSNFEQFKDFELIETTAPDWSEQLDKTLASGQQSIVFLSMCSGTGRQSRIDHLFSLNTERLLIVDEADFGIHKANQSKPLISARKLDDVVILMTGTNCDKAAGIWPVDHYLSVTYPELLMEKTCSNILKSTLVGMI